MGLELALSAVTLASGVPWAGKAVWAHAPSHWWRLGVKAGTNCEGGGSSAGVAKCSLAYTSQKLKYDPAPLTQFSFEKLHILPAVLSFREQVLFVQDALVAHVALDLA